MPKYIVTVGWFLRCMNCGDLFDQTVLANRTLTEPPVEVDNPLPVYRGIEYWGQYLEKIGKVC